MFGLDLLRFRSPERNRETDERETAQILASCAFGSRGCRSGIKVLQARIAKGAKVGSIPRRCRWWTVRSRSPH